MLRGLEDAGHLFRVAGLFIAGLVAFLLLRGVLTPDDFGVYGHFRAGAIEDNRRDPLRHAGHRACTPCHGSQASALASGVHKTLRCEGCHGPLAAHAAKPEVEKATKPAAAASLCLRCHAQLAARPAAFPQVDAAAHAGEATCTDCHAAHSPGM